MKALSSGLAVLFFLGATHLAAQSDTVQVLHEVPIRANRIQPGFDEMSASVLVLTSEQIRTAPVLSIPDVLHYLAGVDIRQRGAHGLQADAGIRGSTFDQVLILINGVKISDLQTGHHSLNLPVDIDNVERIEVLKGPAARIFGQNAFAGAINIITRNPEDSFMKMQVVAGENGLGGGRLSAAFSKQNVQHYFSASRDFSDGYKYNTDYVISNYFYQSTWSSVLGNMNLLTGFTDRSFGANGFYASPAYQDQFESIQTSLVALALRHRPTPGLRSESRLYWRRNQDEYIFVRSNPSLYRNLHTNNTWGYEWNAVFRSAAGITGIGTDMHYLKLTSNNLGDRDRVAATLFVEHRLEWLKGRGDITPGVQLNHYSDFGTLLLPGIDAGFILSRHLKMYGNWGYTYRVPTYTDMYYADPVNRGNPDLQPEYAHSIEAGLKLLNIRWLNLQGSYFIRNGKRIIDWTRESELEPWQPENLLGVNMQGLDLNLEAFTEQYIGWLQRIALGYTWIDAEKVSGRIFSRYALENLIHQFVASVVLNYGKGFTHSIFFRYNDRANLPDFTVTDTRLAWGGEKFSAFLDVTNVFDKPYRETNLVELPGRWIKAGLGYRLKMETQ